MGDVANGALKLCAVALGKDPGTESGVYFVKLDAAYNGELTGRRLAVLGSSNIYLVGLRLDEDRTVVGLHS